MVIKLQKSLKLTSPKLITCGQFKSSEHLVTIKDLNLHLLWDLISISISPPINGPPICSSDPHIDMPDSQQRRFCIITSIPFFFTFYLTKNRFFHIRLFRVNKTVRTSGVYCYDVLKNRCYILCIIYIVEGRDGWSVLGIPLPGCGPK